MATREIINNINLERIRWCCGDVQISLDDLAENLKIPLAKIEQVKLTFNQLSKIANYFGHGALFFLQSEPPITENIHSAQFRTLANQQGKLSNNLYKIIKQVERHRDLYIDLLADLNETPHFTPPKKLQGGIAEKAESVRQWLGLDSGEQQHYSFEDYREKIAEKGIFVLRSQGYNGAWKVEDTENPDEKMLGFSIAHPQLPAIFITKNSPERDSFTLFHELGHLLLHRDSCIDNPINFRSDQTSQREIESNEFSRHCLLPDEVLNGINTTGRFDPSDQKIVKLSKRLGISVEIIVVALLKQGRISQLDYEAYKRGRNAQKPPNTPGFAPRTRHKEPARIFGHSYVAVVLDAMHRGELTLVKASKCLDGIQLKHINQLRQGL